MRPILALSAVLLLLFTGLAFSFRTDKKKTDIIPSPAGFAVVELFTSEGCSSCPPADQAVADIVRTYSSNVFVLGFHVDYWNDLGWTDTLSNPAYTQRQREYASVFQLRSIYTPQVVVNGKKELVGSDLFLLKKTVEKEISAGVPANLSLHIKDIAEAVITVGWKTTGASLNDRLQVALLQLHAVTQVKNGENRGRLLQHINVVREFKTLEPGDKKEGVIRLKLPEGLSPADIQITVFIQDKNTKRIKAAASAYVQGN